MIYFPQSKEEKSVGTALGEGIAALAHGHASQLLRKQREARNEEALKGFGFAPEKAKQLASFDDQILKEVVKNERKKPSMAYSQAVEKLTGGNPQRAQQQQAPLEKFAQQAENPENPAPNLAQDILGQLKTAVHQPLSEQQNLLRRVEGASNERLMQGLQQQGQTRQQPNPNQQVQQQAPAQQQPEEEFKIDYSAMSPEEAKEIYKLQRDKLKQDEELARNRFKDTKEIRKEFLAKGAQARENLESLDRLEDLNKNGNLNSNEYMEFLKGVGLDIPAMMTADTQEFNKITANFIRGAKAIFGSRVTEKELQYYLQTIPQMSNSPEGRQRVIDNLKKLYRGEREVLNTYKEILKENNGLPPNDLAEQVEERSEKKLDAIYKQFKKDIEKPFPKQSSSASVAAASFIGKAVGRLPAAGIGAAGGAFAGSRYLGPSGAIPGAIIGGLAGLTGVSLPKFSASVG